MPVSYTPQYRVHGTTTWSTWTGTITTVGTTLSTTITPLTPSTSYDFQVVASDSFGSATSSTITTTTGATTTIASVTLSNQTFIAGAAIGTVVGSIGVNLTSGTFSGSIALSGANAADFEIVGSNLEMATTATVAGTYSNTITATQSGLGNSPFAQAFTITGSAATSEAAEGFAISTVGPIMYASESMGFADPSGPYNHLALIATNGGEVTLNGTATPSGSVTEIIYHNHTVYQTSPEGWWYWNTGTAAWVEFGVSSITISSSSYAANAPANTVIGGVTVTMKDSSTFSGSYVLSGTNASSFKMVGNNLEAAVTLSATSYSLTITAIPAVTTDGSHAQIGETGVLALTPQVVGTGPAVPAQAAAAGYTTLVFNDDFTTQSIATTQGANVGQGFNWFWSFEIPSPIPSTSWTINTSATAASISNGNSGGGANASSAGGILTINTGQFPSNVNIQTLPGYVYQDGVTALPAVGTGHWKHFYTEAYIQFKINGNLSTNQSNGWPAFWCWSAQSLGNNGFGSATQLTATPWTEIDILESFGSIFGDTPGFWTQENVVWPQETFEVYASGTTDDNWHTWGFLWTTTELACYVDNVLIGTQPVGSTTLETTGQTLYLQLGTGNSWEFNVDWVRLWQA